MNKTWFLTGAGRGLGASIGRAVLAAGHRLTATARDIAALERSLGGASDQFLPLKLDVTDHDAIATAVAAAEARFGGLDILVNNAGYGQMGALEEVSAEDIEAQFRTNVFGLMAVTRAVLPSMRRQRNGHIFNISSMLGYQGAGRCSIYAASKFAVGGFSESLQLELAPFNIKVTVVDPGVFRTDFMDPTSLRYGGIAIDDYAEASNAMKTFMTSHNHLQMGDPEKLARALLVLADAEEPPLRFPVGADAVKRVATKHAAVDNDVTRWRDLSIATAFEEG